MCHVSARNPNFYHLLLHIDQDLAPVGRFSCVMRGGRPLRSPSRMPCTPCWAMHLRHRLTVCTDTPSSRAITVLEWPSWAHNARRARTTSCCAAVFRTISDSSFCLSLFANFTGVAWRPQLTPPRSRAATLGRVPRRHTPAGVKPFDTMNTRAETVQAKHT